MATYFLPKYQEYYDSLSDQHSFSIESMELESIISEVSAEYNAVYGMIDELQGEFTGELYGSIEGLKDELEASAYVLDSLNSILGVMGDLGVSVLSLHDEDNNYEDKQEEYDTEKDSAPNPKYKEGSTTVKTSTYSTWEYNLGVIKESLETLITLCEDLQGTCDADIELIDAFNNAVIDLRLRLVAFAASGGDMAIEDVQNMTLEKKQEYLQSLIDQLEANYNAYRDAYEGALKSLNEFPEEASGALYKLIYNLEDAMGVDLYDYMGAFDTSQTMVDRGMHLINFITAMSNKIPGTDISYMDCFTSYLSGEKSFEESGMRYLVEHAAEYNYQVNDYHLYVDSGDITEEEYVELLEDHFLDTVGYNRKSLRDEGLRESMCGLLGKMIETKDIFEENYAKQLNTGTMIKGTRKLKESLLYDDIRINDSAYDAYEYDRNTLIELVDSYDDNFFVGEDGYIKKDLLDTYNMILNDSGKLSENEKKMLGYLFTSGKYDEAIEYKNIIQNGINLREGTIRAQELYQDFLDGGGVLKGQFVDDLRAAWEGGKNGVSGYVGGLLNLIDPHAEPTENDYYYMELTKLFKQDVFQITDNGNTRFTASQSSSYITDQGYDPLCPDEMTLSTGGLTAKAYGTTWNVDYGIIGDTTVKYTGQKVYVDSKGNIYDDYSYDSELESFVSSDGTPLSEVPTFTDGKKTLTLAGWQAEGYDTVKNRTYGSGEDAIHVDMDRLYSDSLTNSYNAGNKITTTTIKFFEDRFCPGLGTLTFAASDVGNAMSSSRQAQTLAYLDLTDGGTIDNSDNTYGNAAKVYFSDVGNDISLLGDVFGSMSKAGGKIFGEKSPFAVFCSQAETWTNRVNSAYNLPGTVTSALRLDVLNSGAEKLVKSMTGKSVTLTYNTAYKNWLKHRFK